MPPVPVAAALGLAVLPVLVVLSEAAAVLLAPPVLSKVFVLLVMLLFPASSALLTIGAASSVPLITSVTSFRDIFFFFMRSPLFVFLYAFIHAAKGLSSGSMLASLIWKCKERNREQAK